MFIDLPFSIDYLLRRTECPDPNRLDPIENISLLRAAESLSKSKLYTFGSYGTVSAFF